MKIKKILAILPYLLPWFISTIIFKMDTNFYNNLNLPVIAPPPITFAIVWPILYLLISISIYKIIPKSDNKYKISLITNYLSNQLFTLFFFTFKNTFLALIDTIIVLISSIYLYIQTKKTDETASKYIIPYIIWNIYALLLIGSIYFMN